jgi:hypothetical protein
VTRAYAPGDLSALSALHNTLQPGEDRKQIPAETWRRIFAASSDIAAIAALTHRSPHAVRCARRTCGISGDKPRTVLDIDTGVADYIAEATAAGQTIREIAAAVGMKYDQIMKLRNILGCNYPKMRHVEKAKRVHAAYDRLGSGTRVAEELGLAPSHVYAILQAYTSDGVRKKARRGIKKPGSGRLTGRW